MVYKTSSCMVHVMVHPQNLFSFFLMSKLVRNLWVTFLDITNSQLTERKVGTTLIKYCFNNVAFKKKLVFWQTKYKDPGR